MELRQYGTILLKWWWLILLGTVLAGGTAFVVSRQMTPVYQASTTLMVSQGSNPTIADYTAVLTGQQLAKTYGELLKKRPVLEGAIEALQLAMSVEQLAARESVQLVQNTQLIVLQVENEDPVLAAKMADQIAKQFIEQNQATQLSRFASSKDNLQKQLTQMEQEIADTQSSLDKARAASVSAEVTRFEASIAQARNSYSNMVKSYEDIRIQEAKAIDNVTIVEPAEVPQLPVRPNVQLNTLLAAVVGAMLAIGVAFLIEYLDDTIHSPEQVDSALHLPTLGSITRIHATTVEDRLTVQKHPRSTIAEAYRAVRTNVQFSNIDHPAKTILVTSANPVEGKSTTAANLAVAMAQSGRSVALVDTDLRRPSLHNMLQLSNSDGLTTMLLQDVAALDGSVRQTKVEHLSLLPTGPLPPNPSELLGSQRMKRLIELLKQQFDVVIFDSPPVLAVTDAVVLAPQVDGVILVVDSAQTRTEVAQRAVKALDQVGAHFLGVVLNKLSSKHDHYGSYYYYYTSTGEKKSHRRSEKVPTPVAETMRKN